MKICVTGIGVVSSIGMTVEENLASFRAGRRGLTSMKYLDSVHRDLFPVGEVQASNHELVEILGAGPWKSGDISPGRTALLGMIAAREALDMSLSGSGSASMPDDTALISASTVGGMDRSERSYAAGEDPAAWLPAHPCGDSTDRIAACLGIGAYRSTLSTACSSGANAIIHAARLIRHGRFERVVAGGVDALSRFTLNGFNSLMILDKEQCRPYDRGRRGLNLGEGAGFLVLESEAAVRKRGGKVLAILAGYANTNDAYHQTASSPEGEAAYTAMKEALAMAGADPAQVAYINVHGTGTENNDASEGAALVRIFGSGVPAFSSTKSFTGHTLGAAAGLEAVYSVLSIREGMIPPNLGFTEPMEGTGLVPELQFRSGLDMACVMSNSFGFGGNNSSLVFTKN